MLHPTYPLSGERRVMPPSADQFGPRQLAAAVGASLTLLNRARDMGLIQPPDSEGRWWSAVAVAEIRDRWPQVLAAIQATRDLGELAAPNCSPGERGCRSRPLMWRSWQRGECCRSPVSTRTGPFTWWLRSRRWSRIRSAAPGCPKSSLQGTLAGEALDRVHEPAGGTPAPWAAGPASPDHLGEQPIPVRQVAGQPVPGQRGSVAWPR